MVKAKKRVVKSAPVAEPEEFFSYDLSCVPHELRSQAAVDIHMAVKHAKSPVEMEAYIRGMLRAYEVVLKQMDHRNL